MATLQMILLVLAKASSIAFLVVILWVIIKRIKPITFPNVTFLLLSCCYPIAKVCQAWLIGPRVVRWYFANIGAIPLTALLLLVMTGRRNDTETIRKGATIGFISAVLYELMQFALNFYFKISPLLAHRRGDWIDLAICPVVYLAVIYLIKSKSFTKQIS